MTDRLYIQCLQCRLASYHERDIAERFCGRCHRWHVEHPPQFRMGLGRPTEEHPRPGALFHKYLPDDMEVTLYRQFFGWRVCLGETGDWGVVTNAYCYRDRDVALYAAVAWDGKAPILDGWHRNPFTGVRRENGDPSKETRDRP